MDFGSFTITRRIITWIGCTGYMVMYFLITGNQLRNHLSAFLFTRHLGRYSCKAFIRYNTRSFPQIGPNA